MLIYPQAYNIPCARNILLARPWHQTSSKTTTILLLLPLQHWRYSQPVRNRASQAHLARTATGPLMHSTAPRKASAPTVSPLITSRVMQDGRGQVYLIGHLSIVHWGCVEKQEEKHKVYSGSTIVSPKLVTLGVHPIIMKQRGTTLDQGQDGGYWATLSSS